MLPTPPDNSRYSGLDWGTGAVGLTYTAPRRTLRITGGEPTEFSVQPPSPAFRWGTNEDLVFFSTTHAEGFGDEDISPREIHSRLIGENKQAAEATGSLKAELEYYKKTHEQSMDKFDQKFVEFSKELSEL